MAAPAFDLQSHSTCSDGALPPRAVVAAAADAGVELLALTDHDTVDGVDEAMQAGAACGLRAVRMAEALRACGLQLDLPQRSSIGRPHLAQAVFDHPANRMRLAREE